jgi:hypothetical protein
MRNEELRICCMGTTVHAHCVKGVAAYEATATDAIIYFFGVIFLRRRGSVSRLM